jgi:hypothetical protein
VITAHERGAVQHRSSGLESSPRILEVIALPPRRRQAVIVAAALAATAVVGTGAVMAFGEGDGGTSLAPASPGASATPDSSASAGLASTPTPTGPAGPAELLPNLRALAASSIRLSEEGGERVLRFAGSLANAGPGPLELLPDESASCPRAQRGAQQAVYLDHDADGRFDRKVDRRATRLRTGCMLFHADHKHWHFDASARYALARPGDPKPIVSSDKVSFCMRDNRPLRRSGGGAREHFGKCARDSVQGISAGWVDVYRASLPGQALQLPANLPDGVYCLQVTVDPRALLREAREDDNTTVTPVRITRSGAETGPRTGCG